MASLIPTPKQIPFDLSPAKAMNFERFLISDCNEKVVRHLQDWRNWPAPILLLVGESGTGKTHLAKAFEGLNDETCACDDIENMAEAELFSQMNRALTGEVEALLLTSTNHPDRLSIAMPDLRSRLKNTPILQLSAPDDDLLEGITRQLFEDLGRAVSKDAVTYIVSRTARTVPALHSLVQKLEMQAQSDKADMTKAYVARRINQWEEPELF